MTKEQSRLLEKADQTLEEAFILKDKERYSGAISRAYYAMFHAATAALMTHPGKTFKRHAAVHNMFSDYWAKSGKIEFEFHRYLISAFSARSKADYSIVEEATLETAQLHYLHAEAFVRRVRELLQP